MPIPHISNKLLDNQTNLFLYLNRTNIDNQHLILQNKGCGVRSVANINTKQLLCPIAA